MKTIYKELKAQVEMLNKRFENTEVPFKVEVTHIFKDIYNARVVSTINENVSLGSDVVAPIESVQKFLDGVAYGLILGKFK